MSRSLHRGYNGYNDWVSCDDGWGCTMGSECWWDCGGAVVMNMHRIVNPWLHHIVQSLHIERPVAAPWLQSGLVQK